MSEPIWRHPITVILFNCQSGSKLPEPFDVWSLLGNDLTWHHAKAHKQKAWIKLACCPTVIFSPYVTEGKERSTVTHTDWLPSTRDLPRKICRTVICHLVLWWIPECVCMCAWTVWNCVSVQGRTQTLELFERGSGLSLSLSYYRVSLSQCECDSMHMSMHLFVYVWVLLLPFLWMRLSVSTCILMCVCLCVTMCVSIYVGLYNMCM
jgi:hypothetical protein